LATLQSPPPPVAQPPRPASPKLEVSLVEIATVTVVTAADVPIASAISDTSNPTYTEPSFSQAAILSPIAESLPPMAALSAIVTLTNVVVHAFVIEVVNLHRLSSVDVKL